MTHLRISKLNYKSPFCDKKKSVDIQRKAIIIGIRQLHESAI